MQQYVLLRPTSAQTEPPKPDSPIFYIRQCSERTTKTRHHGLLEATFTQSAPAIPSNTVCYGQRFTERATKTRHQDPAVRFLAADIRSERACTSLQDDLLRSVLCRKHDLSLPILPRKNNYCPATRFVTKTRQYVSLLKRNPQCPT